jgi:molybdopterin/thiamine biosynthesis adenylyltransferase
MLNPEQRERYARQLALPEIGEEGQIRLRSARVLVVGVGGLGSPAGFYLAAAGVGTLGLMDADRVALSNLQRQIAHATGDVGRPKVESAEATFRALNPDVRIRTHPLRLTPAEAPAILGQYDFVIDATDGFASKQAVAESCHAAGRPSSHAGVRRYGGQTLTVLPGRTACYRCVFDAAGEEPGVPAGPLGVVPGVIGTIQAAEAIKFALNLGALLTDRLLVFDVLAMRFRVVSVRRDPRCPLCGSRR